VRGGRGVRMAAPTITLQAGSTMSRPARDDTVDAAPGDPLGLDPEFRRRIIPAVRFLHERYWRVEVTGIEHVPADGPALLVANHSGAIPFDGAMICTAIELRRERTLRFLYDRFVDNMGPVASFYRKAGGAVASRENAVRLLQLGELLLVFPEGVSGVAKSFGDRYRLRPFSPGFVRLALSLDVPIVPVAVVGAEEIYPLVGRAEGVGKLFGMPYVPVTPFFPLLGVLGTVPLPTKWFMHFGRPIRLVPVEGEARWLRARHEAMRVRRVIQATVGRLKRRRQSVFFG
jgi:1-acyl-sn-glycerol-3-phosphate acyltransferase